MFFSWTSVQVPPHPPTLHRPLRWSCSLSPSFCKGTIPTFGEFGNGTFGPKRGPQILEANALFKLTGRFTVQRWLTGVACEVQEETQGGRFLWNKKSGSSRFYILCVNPRTDTTSQSTCPRQVICPLGTDHCDRKEPFVLPASAMGQNCQEEQPGASGP